MIETLPFALLLPLLVTLVIGFLAYRLRFFADADTGGRLPFYGGGFLLFVASLWQVAEATEGYGDWFVASAYPIIEFGELLVLGGGLFLIVVAVVFYADWWQTRREEIEDRESRLTVLENLQRDARQPHHLLDLLSMSIREVLSQLPEATGAVFLINRTRRRFVLSTSVGLNREENAHLEYYPLGRNPVSQALELGDPMLVSRFDFEHPSGERVRSRFNSSLLVPLVSGTEKIGVLVFLAEEKDYFRRSDIQYVAPVAQWLAEKIRSARLARDLAQVKATGEEQTETLSNLLSRVASCCSAMRSGEPVDAYCRSMVGLAESESVHVCGVRRGELMFHGSSEPLMEIGESYRTALVDALGRTKPLVINQEVSDESGRSIARSTLVHPLEAGDNADALVLIRTDRAFTVSDQQVREITSLANLARLVLQYDQQKRLSLARRKGFDAVIDLIKAESCGDGVEANARFYLEHIVPVLPKGSVMLVLAPDGNAGLKLVAASGAKTKVLPDSLHFEPAEGIIGEACVGRESRFVYGRRAVVQQLDRFESSHRETLNGYFGEHGAPVFFGATPITTGDAVTGAVLVGVFDLDEKETGEWQRLLTLAAGLFSLRLTLEQIRAESVPAPLEAVSGPASAAVINRINGHLNATIAIADLTARQDDLPGELRYRLQQIGQEVREASGLLKQSQSNESAAPVSLAPEKKPVDEARDLNRALESVLKAAHVSGGLYMAGQRPREIRTRFGDIGRPLAIRGTQTRKLFESVLNRFSSIADEDDVITIATYVKGNFAYLDVSRHRQNFPAVEPVAEFGSYRDSKTSFETRPGDVFLRHMVDPGSEYAYDRNGTVPAFLSFKFPLATSDTGAPTAGGTSPILLLAVDDQPVILDLISAMGRSLGYSVHTAASGEEGLRLAQASAYDIVLTDLTMPGISGLELSRRLKVLQPDTSVILVTGWDSTLKPEELASAGISEVLYKPFRIEQLTELVQAFTRSSSRR